MIPTNFAFHYINNIFVCASPPLIASHVANDLEPAGQGALVKSEETNIFFWTSQSILKKVDSIGLNLQKIRDQKFVDLVIV